MILLEVGRGLLCFFIFARSVDVPFLVADPSGDIAEMTVPVAPVKLEDGSLVSGLGGRHVPIHRVLADSDFPTRVQAVLNGKLVGVRDPVHPVVRRHVLVAQLGTEVVVSESTNKRTYGHGLSYGLEVEGVSVKSENGSTQLLSSDFGLTDAVMTRKDDALATHDVLLDRLVQIFIVLIEKGKIGLYVPSCFEKKLVRNSGHRDGGFEDVNAFVEVKSLELFHGLHKGLDVQIVIPYEEVTEGGHLVVLPYFLTVLVLFFRNVAALKRAVEGLVGWKDAGLEFFLIIKPLVWKVAFLLLDVVGFQKGGVATSHDQKLGYVQEL